MATYEIVLERMAGDAPADVVTGLPPAQRGEVFFHKGYFWRVEAIESARSEWVDGRLIVSLTNDESKS